MILRQIIFIVFFALPIILYSQSNSLVIFTATGNPFNLTVNQKEINSVMQCNVKVFDLHHGWQKISVKLTQENETLTLKDSILLVDEPKYEYKEFTYVLLEQGKKLKLSFISVSQFSGPEIPPVPEAPKEKIALIDNSIYGNLYQAKNNKPNFFTNFDTETSTCQTPLSDKDLKYGLALLSKTGEDEAQVRYVTQIVLLNCYTVSQLYTLIEVLKVELDRLNIAKLAYSHLTDKENIKNILPVFKYQTVKDNFLTFLEDLESVKKQKQLQCKEPMTDGEFKDFFAKIKNTSYDNEKVKVAKKLLVSVCISSSQTKQMLELLSHDREKLELVASAYRVMTDKEQANTLVDEFQFSDSKTEFLKMIKP